MVRCQITVAQLKRSRRIASALDLRRLRTSSRDDLCKILSTRLSKLFKNKLTVTAVLGSGEFGLTLLLKNKSVLKLSLTDMTAEVAAHGAFQKLATKYTPQMLSEHYVNERWNAYVMERLEYTLQDKIFDENFDVSIIITQLPSMLALLSSQNLVHGDLHFGNVGVLQSKIRMLDFGKSSIQTGGWVAMEYFQFMRTGFNVLLAHLEKCKVQQGSQAAIDRRWFCIDPLAAVQRILQIYDGTRNTITFHTGWWEKDVAYKKRIDAQFSTICKQSSALWNSKFCGRTSEDVTSMRLIEAIDKAIYGVRHAFDFKPTMVKRQRRPPQHYHDDPLSGANLGGRLDKLFSLYAEQPELSKSWLNHWVRIPLHGAYHKGFVVAIDSDADTAEIAWDANNDDTGIDTTVTNFSTLDVRMSTKGVFAPDDSAQRNEYRVYINKLTNVRRIVGEETLEIEDLFQLADQVIWLALETTK